MMKTRAVQVGTSTFWILLGGLLLGLYHHSHRVLIKRWSLEDFNYCILIPFIVGFLIWERRAEIRQIPSKADWAGMSLLLVGLFFYALGELGGEYFSLYVSSWFVFVGIIWTQLGREKVKKIAFPLCFTVTMFPFPGFITHRLSLELKLISSKIGVWALQALGRSAYREGNVIDLGFTQLQVVDACSGLRYLLPLIILAILVAYYSKITWWKKGVLILTAIPISIFVNSLRIASAGLLYPFLGERVVEGFFHDFSGWLIFMVSVGIILTELWILKKVNSESTGKVKTTSVDPEKRLAQPEATPSFDSRLTAISERDIPEELTDKDCPPPVFMQAQELAVLMIIGLTLAIFFRFEFREEVPLSKEFNSFPLKILEWRGQTAKLDPLIIDELDLSDYLIVDYKDNNGKTINLYTAFYESQRKGKSIHSPATCLPANGWIFKKTGTMAIEGPANSGLRITANRAVLQMGENQQLSFYWFPCRGRNLTNMWQLKLFNLWDAIIEQRTDGALVRVITNIYNDEGLPGAEQRIQLFIRNIIPILDEFLPQ